MRGDEQRAQNEPAQASDWRTVAASAEEEQLLLLLQRHAVHDLPEVDNDRVIQRVTVLLHMPTLRTSAQAQQTLL